MEKTGMVQLGIDPDLVKPIVEKQIQGAIITAMGGMENLVKLVVDKIMNEKVDEKGNVSRYSLDNKYSWFDVVVTNTIKDCIKEGLIQAIKDNSNVIRDSVAKQLQTKSGSNAVAKALLDAMNQTFVNTWTSKIDIRFNGAGSNND